MYEVVPASAADIHRWRSDPLCPMFDPAVAAAAGARRVVAASAPTPPQRQQEAADDFPHFMHLLGGPFRQYGTPPPSGDFDLPAVPGSASDVQRSHMGCAAQKGDWQ
jgi:hypothetical protein